MEWTTAQLVFIISSTASERADISSALSAEATKGWGWSGADAEVRNSSWGRQLMTVPTDGAWGWAWGAATPASLWRSDSVSDSHRVISTLKGEKIFSESPTFRLSVIRIQGRSILAFGNWSWGLQGHWIILAGKDQMCQHEWWLISAYDSQWKHK